MQAKHTLMHTKGSLYLASSKKYLFKVQECEESQRECFEQTGDLSGYTLVRLHDLISLPFTLFPFNQTEGIPLKAHYEGKTGSARHGHKSLTDRYAKANINC